MTVKTLFWLLAILGTLPATVFAQDVSAPVTHTVVKNDNLWNTAEKFCGGKGQLYPLIANASGVKGPLFVIRPGKVLTIPVTCLVHDTSRKPSAIAVSETVEKTDRASLVAVPNSSVDSEAEFSATTEVFESVPAPFSLYSALQNRPSRLETLAAYVRTASELIVKATGYCPCDVCSGYWRTDHRGRKRLIRAADGITATGKNAYIADGIAADWRVLPRGTKLWLPHVGRKVVDDTGGDMRDAALQGEIHIDVRFQTHPKARAFNVKYLEVRKL